MKKLLIPMLALGGALTLQPALAQDGEALFKSKPCTACHSIDAKLVGPPLKEVAAKYADQPDAVAMLAGHIKNRIAAQQNHPLVLGLNELGGRDPGRADNALDHKVAMRQQDLEALAGGRRIGVGEDVASLPLHDCRCPPL